MALQAPRRVTRAHREHTDRGHQRRYPREVLRRVGVIRVARATLLAGRTPTRDDWSRLSRRWRADLSYKPALEHESVRL